MTNPFAIGGEYPRDIRYQMASKVITGASLPGVGSADGAIVRYKALATATGAAQDQWWSFAYDASDAYWYPLGCAPVGAEIDTAQTTASATYANLATTGPVLTAPFAGNYLLTYGCYAYNAANNDSLMSFDVGAGAADADAVHAQQSTTVTSIVSSSRARRVTLAAGATVTCKYRTSAGTGTFANRFLNMTPLRVH